MGTGEIVLIVVILLLIWAWNLPNVGSGLSRGMEEFKKASDQVAEEFHNASGSEPVPKPMNLSSQFILWLAQGFGVGRIPFAPGTFGSLVGLAWFWILLLPNSPLLFLVGILASIFASVWLCGASEKILRQRDPGSIVMDEIIAIPICFVSWIAILFFQKDFWPAPEYFFSEQNGVMTMGGFLLFRLFDISKPWPVKQSQSLPGGWGVTVDDLLAAVYVNIAVLIILLVRGWA